MNNYKLLAKSLTNEYDYYKSHSEAKEVAEQQVIFMSSVTSLGPVLKSEGQVIA